MPDLTPDRHLLQHFLAAIAYRTQKAVRDAPPEYAGYRAGPGVRTPHQLVRHMSDVLGYAAALLRGETWRAHLQPTFEEEVARFHRVLEDLNGLLATAAFEEISPARLLQGPLADAMTHAGQLALLRRLSGSPIPPENFIRADVRPGRLGPDQPSPASPDTTWYRAEDEPY